MLARLDAWTNMLRLTAAGFGAGVGGADAVVLEPFTAPLGPPTAFARRQARNAQLVLMEEANLGRVSDPAGGAWFLESLTDQLARAGWAAFQSIEAQGGAVAALVAGGFENEVAIARDARQADYREGRANLIGVTRFPNAGAAPPETEPQDPASDEAWVSGGRVPGPDTTVSAMQPMRWSEPFEQEETGDGR
jgi:methylmalonyl-CoA mutase